jgi:hypothetical protein
MSAVRALGNASWLFLRPRGDVSDQLREIADRIGDDQDDDAAFLLMLAQILDEHEAAPPPVAQGWRFRARMRRTSWIERLGMRIAAAMRGVA